MLLLLDTRPAGQRVVLKQFVSFLLRGVLENPAHFRVNS
jgi:hypothetical protein